MTKTRHRQRHLKNTLKRQSSILVTWDLTLETLITFLKIGKKSNFNSHCDPWIRSDGDSIRNSCDVYCQVAENRSAILLCFALIRSTAQRYSHKYKYSSKAKVQLSDSTTMCKQVQINQSSWNCISKNVQMSKSSLSFLICLRLLHLTTPPRPQPGKLKSIKLGFFFDYFSIHCIFWRLVLTALPGWRRVSVAELVWGSKWVLGMDR